MLNKIHLHIRTRINFSINVLRTGTKLPEHKIQIKNAIIDLLNPLGSLTLKTLINLDEISLVASKDQFPKEKRNIMSIFNSKKTNNIHKSKNKDDNILFDFTNTKISFSVTLQRGRDGKAVISI